MNMFVVLAILCVACVSATGSKGQGGHRTEMDVKEVESNKVLMGALDQLVEDVNQKGGRLNKHRIVRHSIVRATKQVVAGVLYKVHIKMVSTTCENKKENDGKSIKECPQLLGARLQDCIVSVWSRPWAKDPKEKLIVKVKCLKL